MNIKFVLIAGLVIAILYFLMSPYQNCMRNSDIKRDYSTRQTHYCLHLTSW